MDKVFMSKVLICVSWFFSTLGMVILLTGCSGIEVGGKLGVYRVDERQESQKTHREPLPLKCYFMGCGSEEAAGS